MLSRVAITKTAILSILFAAAAAAQTATVQGVVSDSSQAAMAEVKVTATHLETGFVREAAHQIRTPLTLVLGEASHALDFARHDAAAPSRTLARVRLAAEQMRRRVDELLLFAEAESGTPIERDEIVELEELAFECTDLMRGRAEALGRQLALAELAPITVRANAGLLREALLEMLENACKHGGALAPVTVRVEAQSHEAHIVVTSALAAEPHGRTGTGLGVSILEWIAAGHGGRFERADVGTIHEARLVLAAS